MEHPSGQASESDGYEWGERNENRDMVAHTVDVPTRMVTGFYLSFDAPSALSVALVLTQAVLPKETWLSDRRISLPWPVSGIPD